MKNFLSLIVDKLTKTAYQNKQISVYTNIKDDDIIINLLSKFILPILMIFGFYIHSHGDYTPGGGFQAGIIFACALCLYYFINLNKKKRLSCNILTYVSMFGFVFYLGFGILSFFITEKFLNFNFLNFKHSNAIGVFIVEFGIMLIVFSSVSRIFTVLLNLLKDLK